MGVSEDPEPSHFWVPLLRVTTPVQKLRTSWRKYQRVKSYPLLVQVPTIPEFLHEPSNLCLTWLWSVPILLLLECSLYSVYYTDPSLFKPQFSPLGPFINWRILKCPSADRRNWVKEGFLQLCWHHISLCRARLKLLLFPCQRYINYSVNLLICLSIPAFDLPPTVCTSFSLLFLWP